MIQTRRLTKTEDTGAIVFYFQTSTTVASMLVDVRRRSLAGRRALCERHAIAGMGHAEP